MVECGYTYEYIDNEMDLIKLAALNARWKTVPPLGETVSVIAQILGAELKQTDAAQNDAALLAQARAEAASLNQGAVR